MVSQIVDKPNIELMWGLFYMFLILILIAEGNYGRRIQLASATGTTAMVQGLSPQLRGLSRVLSTRHNTPKSGDIPVRGRDSPHHSGAWTKWLSLASLRRSNQ